MHRVRLHFISGLLAIALLAAALGCGATQQTRPEQMLFDYVNAPDPSFKWEKGPVMQDARGSMSDIVLTSQTWRGITWRHLLRVVRPAQVKYPGWMALYIAGGSGEPNPGQPHGDDMVAMALVQAAQMPVATLYHVPNQPLFGGMVEDEIISYTFQEYLKDGDPTWPLLFPMAKSAVRALDALQQYAQQEWQQQVHSFIVFGGSKRGWTTWLTAAVEGGKRVKAIAPAVIDVLNMRAQMPHQLELWGTYSEQIADYSSKGLTESFDSPRGQTLWQAVDPYTYRERITIPKLLLLGANDRYWATDALNLYWDGLSAPKYVLYAPNSGHGLEDRTRVFNTLSAFMRAVAGGGSLPQMSWKHDDADGSVRLTITANPRPSGARLWVARSADLDFRDDRWEQVPMSAQGGAFVGSLPQPRDDNIAFFGEADFEMEGRPFTLSTQVRIVRKQ